MYTQDSIWNVEQRCSDRAQRFDLPQAELTRRPARGRTQPGSAARAIGAVAAVLIAAGAILVVVTLGTQSEPREQVAAASVTVTVPR